MNGEGPGPYDIREACAEVRRGMDNAFREKLSLGDLFFCDSHYKRVNNWMAADCPPGQWPQIQRDVLDIADRLRRHGDPEIYEGMTRLLLAAQKTIPDFRQMRRLWICVEKFD